MIICFNYLLLCIFITISERFACVMVVLIWPPVVLCGIVVAILHVSHRQAIGSPWVYPWIYPWIYPSMDIPMDIPMDIHEKICGYGCGYGWEISYPWQAWKNVTCKRDLRPDARDRDETETFDFQSETRPRRSHISPRPRRDRDVGQMSLETETSRPRLHPWF